VTDDVTDDVTAGDPGFPDARVRLVRTRFAPGTDAVRGTMTIHLRGSRFRVVDDAGRGYAEIIADVEAPRGFGATPRSMEEFMDAFHDARRPAGRAPTELRGDLATGEASVSEAGGEPWPADPERLAPVAGQVLFRDPAARATSATSTVLDRSAAEYVSALEGDEDGYHFRSDVRLWVSEPFVLVREVVDATHPGLSLRLEVVELSEGAADL
jgi:hypothetical protein